MKKFFLSGAVVIVAALAGWNFQQNKSKVVLSDVGLANVEALAQESGGSSGGCGTAAYEYNDNWYEDSKNFRRCGDCIWVRGTQPQYTTC
ncbi:MAG: NVEALA domain-containing protein [Tannerellaceae bacterium]|nr:NVEALA domain-containing protein [Tannerellaceae bacterium]